MVNNHKQKQKSVLRQAATANFLLITLFAIALTGLFARLYHSALNDQFQLRAGILAEFLAKQSHQGLHARDRDELAHIAANALSLDDVVSVEVTGGSGERLVNASKNGAKGAVVVSREIPSLGKIDVGFSTQRQQKLLFRTVVYGIGMVLTCLIAILAAQYCQLRALLWPLRGLIDFVGKVGRGDLTQRAPVIRMDEIGRLATAFNHMLDQLGSITVSKNYVNNILFSMAESMIVVDAERRIRRVNQATVSMLGYTEQELIGKPANMIMSSDHEMRAPVRGSECVYRLKDGTQVPVLFSAAPLLDENEAAGEVWLAQDISERKLAEEELRAAKFEAERASSAKSDLLSRTSHELRTPLNAILGFAQLLEMSDLTEMDRSNVEYILKGGRHLLQLINEVLEIAGIESGRRTLSPEAVYVPDAVMESIDLVRPLAAKRNITIRDFLAADHWVMADRQRLQQVLINLLSNAVKYNREGGMVLVECERRPERFLRIIIRDTGAGITQEGLRKLFVPFERLGAEQAGVEGTGLGLSFAKSFIEAMGGTIGVTSTLGVGSTFWIDIPRADAPEMPEAAPRDLLAAPISPDARPNRLLYIEDNGSNRELVERIITYRPSIELITYSTGSEGLAAARERHPDLVLLDLHLPDIWGDEVIRQLKRDPQTSDIPVIMLSADATPRQIQRLLSLGADAYLTKPINVHQLLTVLDEKLAERPVGC